VTFRPPASGPGRVMGVDGRRVTTGAPPWGTNLNADASVALPSGRRPEVYKKAVHPETDDDTVVKTFVDRERGRETSVDPWNLTQRLTYDISRRESRSCRQMTPGYGTGYGFDSSGEERSRYGHESEALDIDVRLEALADDLRRQAKYRDDKHRHRNRGIGEDDDYAITYHRQLTQRLDAMDRQLAELWKFHIELPSPGIRSDGVEASRRQAVPTVRTEGSNTNRERESTTTRPKKRVFGDRLKCWRCGEFGHIRRHREQSLSANQETSTFSGGVAKAIYGLDKVNGYLAMKLRGRRIPCLLDTGGDMTMVPRAVFDLVPEVEMRPTTHRMWAANGTEVQLDGEATIPFEMDGRRLDTEALISPDIEEPMIGAERRKTHRCIWNFQESKLNIDGRAAVMLTPRKKLRCRRMYVDREVIVSTRQRATVSAGATQLSTRRPTTVVAI